MHVAWLAIFRPCQAFEFLPTALLKPLGAEAHRTGVGEPHPREQSWRLPGEVWDSHLAPTGVCLETGERATDPKETDGLPEEVPLSMGLLSSPFPPH